MVSPKYNQACGCPEPTGPATSTLDELAREVMVLRGQRDALQVRVQGVCDEVYVLRGQRDRLRAACLACMEAFDDRYDGAPDAGYQWMGALMHQITEALEASPAQHSTAHHESMARERDEAREAVTKLRELLASVHFQLDQRTHYANGGRVASYTSGCVMANEVWEQLRHALGLDTTGAAGVEC